jgi:hypothetical protein
MHFMQPTKNGNKAPGFRRYKLPCDVWRVDESARIEIRSGVIFESGLVRIERRENEACLDRHGGFRGAGGHLFRQPVRPGSAV